MLTTKFINCPPSLFIYLFFASYIHPFHKHLLSRVQQALCIGSLPVEPSECLSHQVSILYHLESFKDTFKRLSPITYGTCFCWLFLCRNYRPIDIQRPVRKSSEIGHYSVWWVPSKPAAGFIFAEQPKWDISPFILWVFMKISTKTWALEAGSVLLDFKTSRVHYNLGTFGSQLPPSPREWKHFCFGFV